MIIYNFQISLPKNSSSFTSSDSLIKMALATQRLLNQVKPFHAGVDPPHDLIWYNLSLHPRVLAFSSFHPSSEVTAHSWGHLITSCRPGNSPIFRIQFWTKEYIIYSPIGQYFKNHHERILLRVWVYFGAPILTTCVFVLYLRPSLFWSPVLVAVPLSFSMNKYLFQYVA